MPAVIVPTNPDETLKYWENRKLEEILLDSPFKVFATEVFIVCLSLPETGPGVHSPGQEVPGHPPLLPLLAPRHLLVQDARLLVQQLLHPGCARQVVQQEGEGVGGGVHACRSGKWG